MTILFVTGHPAQIHNFKIVKSILEKGGNKVIWAASNKDISYELLELYKIPFYKLARPKSNLFSKIYTLLSNSLIIGRIIKNEKIDLVVSRISPFAGIACMVLKKAHIGLADTEVSGIYDLLFSKMLDTLITSNVFRRSLLKKQIRIPSNIELFYLHPNHFEPNSSIFDKLNLSYNSPFALFRFISWNAYHDSGIDKISDENKIKAIKAVSDFMPVFISSEGILPNELEKYRINIPSDEIHSVLYFSSFYFGEGASMAAEAAVLGTPAIYVNSISLGYIEELEKHGLLYSFGSDKVGQKRAIEKALIVAQEYSLNMNYRTKKNEFLKDKIDASTFLAWFIINYPSSEQLIRQNPDFIMTFK
jgi:predicted glycosyltransferase